VRADGAPRTYRRADVEQVLRIKHLLLVEGLTLAGARRKLSEEQPDAGESTALAEVGELLGAEARDRILSVRARQFTGRSRVIVEFYGSPDVRAITGAHGVAARTMRGRPAQVADISNLDLATLERSGPVPTRAPGPGRRGDGAPATRGAEA